MGRALLSIVCCMIALSSSPAHAWSTFWDGTGEPDYFTQSGEGGATVNLESVNRGMRIEDTTTAGGHNFYYRSTTGTSVTIGTRFKVEAHGLPADGTGRLCLMTLQAGSSPSPRLSVGIKTVGGVDKFVLLNVKDGAVLHELQVVDNEWHEARLYCYKSTASYQFWWDSDPVRSGTAATSTTSGTRAFGASSDYGSTGTSRVVFDYFGYNTGVFTPEKDPPVATASSPEWASGPVTIRGTATDASGISKVYLWYRTGTGSWTYYGEASSISSRSGAMLFDFPEGPGTYYFFLQAQDKNGNLSSEPSGDTYHDSTTYQPGLTYSLDNGYFSFSGSSGEMRDVRFDPTGAGSYRRITANRSFYGEICPSRAALGFDVTESSITMEPVDVYSLDTEMSATDADRPDRLNPGQTLGQSFTTTQAGLASVSVKTPTWLTTGAAMTLSVYKDGPGGLLIASRRITNLSDNAWHGLSFVPQDAGTFYIEMSQCSGTLGWWTNSAGTIGQMYVNGVPGSGTRTFKAGIYSSSQARITITLDGPNLTTQVTTYDYSSRNWHMVTPFESQGYEISDPGKVPFSRFYSDKGHYMPISQLKRRTGEDTSLDCGAWALATGNGDFDLRISPITSPMYWAIDSGTMDIKLGTGFGLTVEPHSDSVPDFYPAFYTSDPAFDRVLNSFLYDRAFSWWIGGVAADWFEWTALINFWMARPGLMEHWRSYLQTYSMDAEGYVYSWGGNKGWPFPDNTLYDTRHFTTNPNFILACWRYYAWTKDREFLTANAARIRLAMSFQLNSLGGSSGIITLPSLDHGGTPSDLASNYWDDIPFGGQSAYENAYFYASLLAMAEIESALGDSAAAATYTSLAATCRQRYNELFWNNTAGRYIGCIDENGVRRDYGFTYVNMEAATYGLPDQTKVQRIYNWMESGDTYTRFRFAPRANTIDCRNWWYLNGTAEIPAQTFDTHLENGGAILYTLGYDIMARSKYLGADNACARLQAILDRYMEPDRLSGGSPLYYGENNGWQVGTDVPFPESGLVPASFLYAFVGVQANAKGLTITPNVPGRFSYVGVRNLRYQGMMLDIRVTPTSVRIACTDPGKEFIVDEAIEPGGSYSFGGRISSTKCWPNGTNVQLDNKVLSYRTGTVGYIQEADRSSGIRVQGTISALESQFVSLTGTLQTTENGERYVQITTMAPGAQTVLAPLGATGRNLSPSGIGVDMTGLLVRAWGKIKEIQANGYRIDDGSNEEIWVSGVCPGAVGDFVTVTGPGSLFLIGATPVRLLLPGSITLLPG